MDKAIIKRLEKIIDDMEDCYDLEDNDPRMQEIRELAGCKNLDDEQIYNYCFHYWQHHSLQETVYALMNNEKYPEKNEVKIYFWKLCKETTYSNQQICEAYRFDHIKDKAKEIINHLEVFPLTDIFSWIEKTFPDFVKEEQPPTSKDVSLYFYNFSPKIQKEYAIKEKITISVWDEQMVAVGFEYIDVGFINKLKDYMKNLGYTKYYNPS